MSKLKFKKDKGLYRLHLTHTELELIAVLVRHVRLGNDDYQNAALDLIQTFDENPDLVHEDLSSYIHFDVTPETEHEDSVIEIYTKSEILDEQSKVVDGQWPFPLPSQAYTGCANQCPGCSCDPAFDEQGHG